ncbi:hypothetical protein [Arthrobacter echini]|uniref:hypothetical protein n=1 Tax=Arthrobacter echini TaxID=1529066 RepID=UPI001FE53878|nr:hypothetical protein [Arthrobacter echini]
MTSEQPPPIDPAEQPEPPAAETADTYGAVPADGRPGPAELDPASGAGSAEPEGTTHAANTTDSAGSATPAYREVTVRRAPKIVPFMALGAVAGFLAALVVAYTGPADPTVTRESVLGFFTVAFAVPGLLLAALLVLVIDRRSIRRAERARAERTFDDD